MMLKDMITTQHGLDMQPTIFPQPDKPLMNNLNFYRIKQALKMTEWNVNKLSDTSI